MSRLEQLFASAQRQLLDAEMERVKADPKAHRLTRTFLKHTGYTFWTDQRRRQTTRWCVSINKNIAGYYLIWREVYNKTKKEWRRDKWDASKDKRDLFTTAAINAGARRQYHGADI